MESGNPFRYGEAVRGDFFTDRYHERELLLSELSLGHKVLLSGPRKSGKSSLARKVMSEFEHRGVMTVYIDLERAYSPARFIEVYLNELLRAAFRQAKELRAFIQELNSELIQLLRFKIENSDELILDFSENQDVVTIASAVLELAPYAANYKKRLCVVCFDEISEGGNLPEALRYKFFEVARQQAQVGYLLVSLTAEQPKDISGFTSVMLNKIEERYLKAYIKTRFENTGFRIAENVIAEMLTLAEGHAHYVQMLCRKLWNQSHNGKVISSKSLAQASEALLEVHAEYYSVLWSDLSLHQKNLLLAICKGGGQKIFSQDYVAQFSLGSFSTVQKSLNRLLEKKILERQDDHYTIRDLFFRRWLMRRMV